uniref:LysM domain-containing protein n=1 Tax=Tetradesmus obliquus TaxID=3088 RepID=A0A383W2T4_TETOB
MAPSLPTTCGGPARRLLVASLLLLARFSAAAAALSTVGGTHDALWQQQCGNIQEVYTVQPGNTAQHIMAAAYPGMQWEPMWSLVALCNKAAVGFVDPGVEGQQQLDAGITLSLPVFQLPTAQQVVGTHRSSQRSAGNNNSSRIHHHHQQQQQQQQRMQALQLCGICGCGPSISIKQQSTWLGVVTAAYPHLQPPSTAALWLLLCNPAAASAAAVSGVSGLLQPGQQLQGICSAALAPSLSQLQHVTSGSTGRLQSAAAAAAAALSPSADAAAAAAAMLAQSQEPACSVSVVSGHGSYLQQVSLQPPPLQQQQQQQQLGQEVVCPWYADGCSGPSDGLAYQDVLTPW